MFIESALIKVRVITFGTTEVGRALQQSDVLVSKKTVGRGKFFLF